MISPPRLLAVLLALTPSLAAQITGHGPLDSFERIQHGELTLTFARSPIDGDITLDRLENRKAGLAFRFAPAPLWRAEWLDLATGETREVDARAALSPPRLRRREENGALVVTVEWSSCVVGEERFGVHLEVRLPAEGSSSEWRLAVDARAATTFSVQAVELRLAIRPPAGGEKLHGIIPYRGALEVVDPQLTLRDNPARGHVGNKLSAQLFPVYTDGGQGLYLAAHDPDWHYKRLRVDGDGEAYHLGLQAFSEDQTTPGRSYLMSYPWVVGLYQGGWYEAGQLYREFASDQIWLRHGKLADRADVPSWWKELDLLELHTFQESDDVEHTLAGYRSVRQFYGIPPGGLAVAHWAWFDTFGSYESLPKLQTTLDRLAAEGVRSLPYIWSYAYDSGHPSYTANGAQAWAKKDFFGGSVFDPFAPWSVVVLDPAVAAWHDRIEGILGRLGTDGVYLDNPFETHPDYDGLRDRRGYGHHMVAGFHALMSAVRNGRRGENPDFVITYESMFEGFLSVSDMIAPENPYAYNPIARDGTARYVPLYDSVYHDYTITLAANSKMDFFRAKHFIDLDDAVYTLAHGFSLGKMLTSVESLFELGGPPNHWLHPAPIQRYVGALKRFIKARRQYQDFLVYGQLLRPLQTSAPIVTKTLLDPPSGSSYLVQAPSALSSVWRAPDGRLGILLVNYSKYDLSLTYDFDLESYGLESGNEYALVDGASGWLRRRVSTDFTESVKLPAVDLRFFVLRDQ